MPEAVEMGDASKPNQRNAKCPFQKVPTCCPSVQGQYEENQAGSDLIAAGNYTRSSVWIGYILF